MTFQTVHNAIRNRFSANVIDTSSAIDANDVCWDNTAFSKHDNADTVRWVRFQVLPANSEIRELGQTTARTEGIALASVFMVAGQGDKLGLALADEIVAAFKAITHTHSGTTVSFRTPSVLPIGRTDGPWWQINVSIPFYTDDA